MRPLTAAVAAAGRGRFVLDGVARMRERPIADLVDGLVQLGVDAKCTMGTGCPPVEVNAQGLPSGKVGCVVLCVWAQGLQSGRATGLEASVSGGEEAGLGADRLPGAVLCALAAAQFATSTCCHLRCFPRVPYRNSPHQQLPPPPKKQVQLSSSVSSQYLTALLIILNTLSPRLLTPTPTPTHLKKTGPVEWQRVQPVPDSPADGRPPGHRQ
jgi:hypothetical protein